MPVSLAFKHLLPFGFAHQISGPPDFAVSAGLGNGFGDIGWHDRLMVGARWRDEVSHTSGHCNLIADIGSVSGEAVGYPDPAIAGSLDAAVVMPDDERAVVTADPKASVRVKVKAAAGERLHSEIAADAVADQDGQIGDWLRSRAGRDV